MSSRARPLTDIPCSPLMQAAVSGSCHKPYPIPGLQGQGIRRLPPSFSSTLTRHVAGYIIKLPLTCPGAVIL